MCSRPGEEEMKMRKAQPTKDIEIRQADGKSPLITTLTSHELTWRRKERKSLGCVEDTARCLEMRRRAFVHALRTDDYRREVNENIPAAGHRGTFGRLIDEWAHGPGEFVLETDGGGGVALSAAFPAMSEPV